MRRAGRSGPEEGAQLFRHRLRLAGIESGLVADPGEGHSPRFRQDGAESVERGFEILRTLAPPSSRTSQRAAANLSIGPARVRRPLARPGLRACIRACPPDGSRVLGGRRRVASIIGFTEIVRRPTQCPPTAASSRRPVPAAEENDASLPTSEPVGSTPRPRDIGYERATNVIADRSRLEVQDRVRAHREGAESNDGRRGGREPEAV